MHNFKLSALALLAAVPITAPAAVTDPKLDELVAQGRYCSATARAAQKACANQTLDDYWIAVGTCLNEPESRDRKECLQDAEDARVETVSLCADQTRARLSLCGEIGEGRYHPEFEARDFDSNFRALTNPNPYYPLAIGSKWEFRSADEINTIEVKDNTKLIDDVHCIVVRDEVFSGGVIKEGTNDWFAQAKDGNVWYCGEETGTYETFRGDRPRKPELVSIDGSFKAERDGDRPGIIFQANPVVGQFYIEEASLGNAEDASEVLSVSYTYGKDPELDELVPPALAKLLCHGDCVVTRNFSQLEPDGFERKYYARGIGVFLETGPQTGEVVRLVKCNVDPRCALLPR
jgi:hypothetical protein